MIDPDPKPNNNNARGNGKVVDVKTIGFEFEFDFGFDTIRALAVLITFNIAFFFSMLINFKEFCNSP